MKRGKRIVYAMLSSALLSVFALSPMRADAGVGATILDSESLKSSNWSNPEEDVIVSEGVITFPEESTEYTRYISKMSAKIDKTFSELVRMSASIKFNQLPEGERFILAFGLSEIESLPGEANNVEVTFTNRGGIKVGITAYDEDGNSTVVAESKACGMSMKKAGTVEVRITSDSKINVSINGRSVASGKLPVTGEGRVGFMQTGGCAVEVSNLEIAHYLYDRPENANIFEDFEQGGMDVSVLTARALDVYGLSPRGQMIEDYQGSQVFRFENTGVAYLGTLYQYSNFEMSFDVPFIQTETEYHKDGSLKKPGQYEFAIGIGGEQADWDIAGWSSAAETIVFDKTAVYSLNHADTSRYAYTQEYFTKQNGGFSVKVSIVDGLVNIGMKWMNESKYQHVLEYSLKDGTPNGYIHIWSTETGQFAIDNLKIENLDENANVIQTEYKSGKWVKPDDAVYQPMERVYNVAEGDDRTVSWYMLIPVAVGVGAMVLAITALLTRSKRIQKKGAPDDEK